MADNDDGGMQAGIPTPPPVVAAEIFRGGVLITFANGKCALYSYALLYEIFGDAEEVIVPIEEE